MVKYLPAYPGDSREAGSIPGLGASQRTVHELITYPASPTSFTWILKMLCQKIIQRARDFLKSMSHLSPCTALQ